MVLKKEELGTSFCNHLLSLDTLNDYLFYYRKAVNYDRINFERLAVKRNLGLQPFFNSLNIFHKIKPFKSNHILIDSSVVEIGKKDELNDSELIDLQYILRFIKPWKKGPFTLFDTPLDSEWRSDLKWQRIEKSIGSLSGKRIADIGSNNGYFLFRMAASCPELVIGFEPVIKHWCTFSFLQSFAQVPSIHFEPLGVESLVAFDNFFHTVFCLGILYHHPDPHKILTIIYKSLQKRGKVIIDCQGIEGEESSCFFPGKRYAGAKGVWYLPTLPALFHWLSRAGFKKIECFYNEKLSSDEQRPSVWAPIKSLNDFLLSGNDSLTVEGYLAPRRFYVLAEKV
ncbi:MAG: tRNA 5-methoxyuridine(34)/uridine 5-oxyacetic acid(34) synthase CmoB [Zetaproteobacteria bacterium]|nr:tRNA 5-methoxyuridine(34)/uridine 5-oxyacetic acid(34) synthase CmoB [Pseudobdellovibrionaceae bacterium]|tara:strand:- start:2381 stop:3400 length:1020 start_codon:yes stop_codon:yes gene_type:complete